MATVYTQGVLPFPVPPRPADALDFPRRAVMLKGSPGPTLHTRRQPAPLAPGGLSPEPALRVPGPRSLGWQAVGDVVIRKLASLPRMDMRSPIVGDVARVAALAFGLTGYGPIGVGFPGSDNGELPTRVRRSLPFPSTGRPRLLPTSFAKHPCSGRGTSQVSRLPYISQIVPAAPLAPETVRRRDRKVRPLYVEPADAGDY